MLGFLRRLFSPATPPPSLDLDGPLPVRLRDGVRHYDPIDLRLALNKALPDWREVAADVAAGAKPLPPKISPEMAAAREARLDAAVTALSDAVSVAFALPPVAADGSGYTRGERVMALAEFLVWTNETLETTRPLPFGGEPTASPASAAPSQPANATA